MYHEDKPCSFKRLDIGSIHVVAGGPPWVLPAQQNFNNLL